MLEQLQLVNYRGHSNTRIPLARFSLLVGDNGVGKSSTLEAVDLAGLVLGTELPNALLASRGREVPWLRRSGSGDPMSVQLIGTENGIQWSVALTAKEQVLGTYSWTWGDRSGSVNEESSGPRSFLETDEVRRVLRSVVLKLNFERLAEPSTSDEEQPTIAQDGFGLATALQFLKVNDLEAFGRFEEAAARIIPSLKQVKFGRVRKEGEKIGYITLLKDRVPTPEKTSYIADELRLVFQGTDAIPARYSSEGTLLVLGLLAFLHLPVCPRIALLDDIDRALHPRAQTELVASIRRILEERPATQVIATAHSPYLADSFAPEEVIVLGRPKGGPIAAQRLADHPDKKLLRSLTTGEFLAASGADWFGL